jgi:hypothetical protein
MKGNKCCLFIEIMPKEAIKLQPSVRAQWVRDIKIDFPNMKDDFIHLLIDVYEADPDFIKNYKRDRERREKSGKYNFQPKEVISEYQGIEVKFPEEKNQSVCVEANEDISDLP